MADSFTIPLAKKFPKARCLIPLLVLVTTGVILVGQNMPSFAIHVSAAFTRTNLTNVLQQELDQIHPPMQANFTFSSIDAKVANVRCASFMLSSAWLLPSEDGNELLADVSGLSGVCTGLWEYEESIWPHVPCDKGSVIVDISNVNVSAKAKVQTTPENHLLVSIVSCSATVTIRNIDFEGGVVTVALVSVFKKKIKDALSDNLQRLVCSEIENVIATNFNASNSTANSTVAGLPSFGKPHRSGLMMLWSKVFQPRDAPKGATEVIFSHVEVYSVWQSVTKLLEMQEHFLGGALLILSGLWPHFKQLILLMLWLLPIPAEKTHKVLFWIDMIGKWSMVDVLFVGMLMVVLRLNINFLVCGSLFVVPLLGVYVYAFSICLSMALTMIVTHMARAALQPDFCSHEMSSTSEDVDVSHSYPIPVPDDRINRPPAAIMSDDVSQAVLPTDPHDANTSDDMISHASTTDVLTPLNQPHPLVDVVEAGLLIPASIRRAEEAGDEAEDGKLRLSHLWCCMGPIHEDEEDAIHPHRCWRSIGLFLAILVDILVTALGLWLFMCEVYDRVHVDIRGINIYGNDRTMEYSVIHIIQVMAASTGGYTLAMLFFVFVVFVPLLKWVLALGFWSLCSQRCMWRYVHLLQPLDMRDVFMVTLFILCLRIRTTTEGLSQGFASMKLSVSEMPGFYFTLIGIAIDYFLFGYSLKYKNL